MNTSLNYQRNHLIFTGQYLRADEYAAFAIPSEDSEEVALMAGWANRLQIFYACTGKRCPNLQSGMKRGAFIRRVEGSGGFDLAQTRPL
ncbi:MAG: hypothetical protein U5M51_09715 [Emticicia sp.]|nr:hypothetical protein [Emticicia sp.]